MKIKNEEKDNPEWGINRICLIFEQDKFEEILDKVKDKRLIKIVRSEIRKFMNNEKNVGYFDMLYNMNLKLTNIEIQYHKSDERLNIYHLELTDNNTKEKYFCNLEFLDILFFQVI